MGEPSQAGVDAVEFPISYKAALGHLRGMAITEEAKILLACARPQMRNHGTSIFATAHHADSLLFPKWHERSGESRYEWVERSGADGKKDGVRIGRLVEGAAGMVGATDPRGPDDLRKLGILVDAKSVNFGR